MRQIFKAFIVGLGLFSSTVMAGSSHSSEEKISQHKTHQVCSSFSDIGAKIMEARQVGTPLKDIMEAIEVQEKSAQSVQKAMAIDAYAIPQFAQETQRQKAISLFKTEVYEACKLDLKKR